MHFGKSNPKAVYIMMDDDGNKRDIEQTNLERDLGITVDNNLKWSEHVHRMVGKANRILGMLKRTFESRDHKIWKDLYESQVSPLGVCCASAKSTPTSIH